MPDVDVTLRLPEQLVEKARTRGVINNERIALLLQAELERLEGWQSLDQSLTPAREAFRADYADMSETELMALIDESVREVRAERKPSPHENADKG